jgi:hypothetical protein
MKKCCPMGSHKCNVAISNPPKHFGYTRGVCADKCLVPAIKELWKAGFRTIASCCGHGKIEGNIFFVKEQKNEKNNRIY